MNILQLRYFTTVAQLENMSKAADLLHLSQSSLSKNIAKLEEELGMPLFDRYGKKIVLNAPGSRFLEGCNRLLRELDATLEDMGQLNSGADRRIRIGMAGIHQRMIACVAAFRQENPEARFDLNGAIEARDTLDINEFDVLIYPAGGRYERYIGYPFCEERYFLMVSGKNELAGHVSVMSKALDGQDFVFRRSDRTALEYPYQVCTALNVRFRSQCFVDTTELHRQMIAADLAVGFVTENEAPQYQNDPGLRLIPILDQRFSRQMMICFRRQKHLSQLARDFRAHCIRYFSLPVQE